MSFWGIEVKPDKPITHHCYRGRLRISQASLGNGDSIDKSVIQCTVGSRSPKVICILIPNVNESTHLELEFAEVDDVIFSVLGTRSVYLTGYYIRQNPHSLPHSDSESYGMDIENSYSHGSSDGDSYNHEDSIINDDGESSEEPSEDEDIVKETDEDIVQEDSYINNDDGSHLTPTLNSKETDEDIVEETYEDIVKETEEDTPRNNKGCRKLKKRCQVIESDNDDMPNENDDEDEDGLHVSVLKYEKYTEITLPDTSEKAAPEIAEMDEDGLHLSVLNNKKDTEMTLSDTSEKIAPEIAEMGDDAKDTVKTRDNESDEKVNDDDISSNFEREPEMDDNLDKLIQAICEKNEPPMQSSDIITLEKEIEELPSEEKTYDMEINRDHPLLEEDKSPELETPNKMEIAAEYLVGSEPDKTRKTKKRKKNKGTVGDQVVTECHNVPKDNILHGDDTVKDLPENRELKETPIESNVPIKSEVPVKDIERKRKKKKRSKGGLNMTDNQEETMIMKSEAQNSLIIETLANGAPDGKVAVPGNKVRIYYTAKLKENGQTFSTNFGKKKPLKFLLGDENVVESWNLGVDGMQVGEYRRLTVPPSMGFGSVGLEGKVPPNSWLEYEIELVSVLE